MLASVGSSGGSRQNEDIIPLTEGTNTLPDGRFGKCPADTFVISLCGAQKARRRRGPPERMCGKKDAYAGATCSAPSPASQLLERPAQNADEWTEELLEASKTDGDRGWICGESGEKLECPPGEAIVGICNSGEPKSLCSAFPCKSKAANAMLCKKHTHVLGKGQWLGPQNAGSSRECPQKDENGLPTVGCGLCFSSGESLVPVGFGLKQSRAAKPQCSRSGGSGGFAQIKCCPIQTESQRCIQTLDGKWVGLPHAAGSRESIKMRSVSIDSQTDSGTTETAQETSKYKSIVDAQGSSETKMSGQLDQLTSSAEGSVDNEWEKQQKKTEKKQIVKNKERFKNAVSSIESLSIELDVEQTWEQDATVFVWVLTATKESGNCGYTNTLTIKLPKIGAIPYYVLARAGERPRCFPGMCTNPQTGCQECVDNAYLPGYAPQPTEAPTEPPTKAPLSGPELMRMIKDMEQKSTCLGAMMPVKRGTFLTPPERVKNLEDAWGIIPDTKTLPVRVRILWGQLGPNTCTTAPITAPTTASPTTTPAPTQPASTDPCPGGKLGRSPDTPQLGKVDAATFDECKTKCQNTQGCRAVVYHFAKKACRNRSGNLEACCIRLKSEYQKRFELSTNSCVANVVANVSM